MPLLFSAIFISVFFLIFWTFPTAAPGSKLMLVSELLRQYDMTGSYDQRSAFTFSVLAIFVLSVAAFFVGKRGLVAATHASVLPSANIWMALLVTVAGLSIYALLIPGWMVTCSAVTASAFFLFVVFGRNIGRRPIEFLLLLIIGAYLSMVVVPGLLVWPIPILVSDPDSIAQVELHLAALVQPGSGIAAGQNVFREIPYSYGMLMPSIISVIDHRIGGLSVGGHIRFVQFCQVAFALTAAAAYFCYRPRSYLGVLAALLLAAPYWISGGLGIWHPNQTGMRSLTLPLGILALTLAGRYRPNNAAWGLGAVGMVALLINIETTIAVAVGVLVYYILRTRSVPLVPILRATISAAVVFVGYLVCYRIGLGRLPFGIDIATIASTFSALTSGDIGMRLFAAGPWAEGYFIVPLAFVMFLHAAYVVFAAFFQLGNRPLSHRQALRPAIAAMLIIWFSYYFNMPNWWQIWTHFFLYGFLLIDLFDLRLFGIGTAGHKGVAALFDGNRMKSRIVRIVPIFFLAVVLIHTNSNLVYFMRDFMFPPWIKGDHDAAVVSGVLVPRAAGDALKEKAKKLSELNSASGGKVRYLTFNVEFVPMLTRQFEPAPTRSLWGYVAGDDALDPDIDKVIATQPAAILIDAPTGPLAVTGPRKEFQDRVRASVRRGYHLAETVSGWEVYRPGANK